MRILLTADPELPVPPPLYGGIERIVDALARGLKRRGHEVALAAHSDSTVTVDQFCPWPGKSSLNRLSCARNTIALHAAVRAFKPDLVHSFSRLAYLLPILKSSLPKVMTYERKPTARTVRQAACLAGSSLLFTGCSDSVSREGRMAAGEWRTVHNGVDMDRYTFQPKVTADAPLIFLSRVEKLKGAHLAIAAAKKAGRPLIIAGNYGQTPEDKRYWEQEIQPHLGKNGIDYIGPLDDARKNVWLGKAAALIVPIEWEEPFGIVFAEALACGTPVISCPRGALPEIIQPGVQGFLETQLDGLVQAIQKIPEISRAACRQRAESHFSTDVMVSSYLSVYHEVIHRPTLASLPTGLHWLQRKDFPHKLGICERLFGKQLSPQGISWTETGAGLPWKLDLANPTHRWVVYGKYEGSPFLDWAKKFLPSNGIVVDSGANIGQMLLYLAQWVPQGKVLAFEPGSSAADWLQECLQRHSFLPVELLRVGLGEKVSRQHLTAVGPSYLHGSWNQISETATEGEAVTLVTLAQVLEERSLHTVDLWKLDVEGYEVPALRGAESLLREKRIRALYIELAGENGGRIRDYLATFGYQGFLFENNGTLTPLTQLPEHTNGLFLPGETR